MVLNPMYVRQEGSETVFGNLTRAGTTAVGIWPYVERLSDEKHGSRVPDLHIDGERRVLGRPLWGRRALYVQSYLAYTPEIALYEPGSYRPPAHLPPGPERDIVDETIAEARARGLEVYLGVSPFTPPGTRSEDQPLRVDGLRVQPPYVARNACLNSPDARHYALAMIQDTVQHYPQAGGLILDWVEYGAYRLADLFTCFCRHCRQAAIEAGYGWKRIEEDVLALWQRLHRLTAADLEHARCLIATEEALADLLSRHPGLMAFIRFKREVVGGFYREVRQLLDRLGIAGCSLTARCWCSPWNHASGSDYATLAGICEVVSPKLFTFDHAALPRWYGQTLKEWNPALAESDILETLLAWMQLPDSRTNRRLAQYRIPAPDESHPTNFEAYRRRIDEMVAQVHGRARCLPITHPYLPDDQWEAMVTLVRDSGASGMWVNMYGYLTDAKLKILAETWTASNKMRETNNYLD
jgi:hypothetical protein